MTREEDKKLLAELMFVGEQLKGNIAELRKLDGIAKRAEALNEIDTHAIAKKLEDVSFSNVSYLIVKKLNEQFEAQTAEISKGANAAEAAAKNLSEKAENLRVVADGFNNLDNMSQNLDEFVKKFKSMSVKNLYLGVILATVTGIFTGGILSYASQTVGVGNPATPAAAASEGVYGGEILAKKFGEVGAVQDNRDPKLYYIVIPDGSKVREVASFVEDGKRFIRIEAKK